MVYEHINAQKKPNKTDTMVVLAYRWSTLEEIQAYPAHTAPTESS